MAAAQRRAQENREEEDRIASETAERALAQIDKGRQTVSRRVFSYAEAIQQEKQQAKQVWVRGTQSLSTLNKMAYNNPLSWNMRVPPVSRRKLKEVWCVYAAIVAPYT